MLTRRSFLASASAAIVCAPPIVRATSLMPLHGMIIPAGELQFGFCDRLCVHSHLSPITRLQSQGLSLQQVASELSRHGPGPWVNRPWDLQFVTAVVRRDQQIKRIDKYLRLKRQFML